MSFKIYLITNHASDKKMYYVGQTIHSIDDRFTQHVRQGSREKNCHLHKALIEYGRRNFTIQLLEDGILSQLEAKKRETYYIKKYLSHYIDGCGYNMKYETTDNNVKRYHGADVDTVRQNIADGKAWNSGVAFSQESRAKISTTKKHRKVLGLYSSYGHSHSDETKIKLSIIAKNRDAPTEQTKNKWREQSSGRKFIHNLATKERRSVKNLSSIPSGWLRGRGTCWINNGIESLSVDVWDINIYLNEGYNYGRVIKNCGN